MERSITDAFSARPGASTFRRPSSARSPITSYSAARPCWRTRRETLIAGDILLFPHGSAHALHDGSDAAPAPARQRSTLNVVFHENEGTGDRLDMMCGRFIISTAHDRLIRSYLPRRVILHAL